MLISAHQPPYALRHSQMEAMFLSVIDIYSHEFEASNMNRLIISETTIFDVLHQFFYHSNITVCKAALEVYVRRAYISYEMVALHHLSICASNDNKPYIPATGFHFILPSSHHSIAFQLYESKPESTSVPKNNELTASLNSSNYRIGLITAFNNLEHIEQHFDELLKVLRTSDKELFLELSDEPLSESPSDQAQGTTDLGSSRERTNLFKLDFENDNIHILNIAIKQDISDDSILSKQFENFCQIKSAKLIEHGVRRVTFIVCQLYCFPRYFTYRQRDGFTEDKIYRHLEPALAFQLEINRLRNYDLEAVPTANQRMHLYLGKAKSTSPDQQVTDYRFFIRAIIRHSDLITKEASYEFLQNEGERLLLEALDELEVAFTHPAAKRTDCNHIFFNFVPKVTMDPTKVSILYNIAHCKVTLKKTSIFIFRLPKMLKLWLIITLSDLENYEYFKLNFECLLD